MSNNKFTSVVPNLNGMPNVNAPLLGKPKKPGFMSGMLKSLGMSKEHKLEAAVKDGSLEGVHKLIKSGANVDGVDGNCEPLGIACRHGNIEVVKLLLDSGASVDNGKDDNIEPPLLRLCFYAPRDVYNEILNLLIRAGANPNKGANGISPLYRAQSPFNLSSFTQSLIAAGADVNQSNIGDYGMPSPSGSHRVLGVHRLEDTGGFTALHVASFLNLENNVRILLENGANVNAKNGHGKTPLFYATQPPNGFFIANEKEGRSKVIEMLIAAGGEGGQVDEAQVNKGGKRKSRKHHSKKRKTRRKA